ncbi:hypothetical protein F0562_016053 [Nyssa sinensis]|uniref:Uncharacterized protein n=1 Tax=Nyssa sinensis TaxID=561372 RepID=A0A5J4ZKT0_9ASTE|nr:hypothetical protein F0562_016053 [Nyssa sinensis]
MPPTSDEEMKLLEEDFLSARVHDKTKTKETLESTRSRKCRSSGPTGSRRTKESRVFIVRRWQFFSLSLAVIRPQSSSPLRH